MFELGCVLSFSEVLPSHPYCVVRCLIHLCLHHSLHRFLHLHPVRRLLLRCSTLRRVHPLPLRKEGCSLAAWANSLLSQAKNKHNRRFRQCTAATRRSQVTDGAGSGWQTESWTTQASSGGKEMQGSVLLTSSEDTCSAAKPRISAEPSEEFGEGPTQRWIA